MRNIKLVLEYDGSRYSGWQRLGKEESTQTIENKLLEIIKKMSGENAELFCGARTESGAHAYAQVLNFKTNSDLKLFEIKHYFNRYLPMDIAVLEVEEKSERFHASLNATSRKYIYRIAIGDVPSVFERKYVYHCFHKLNINAMKEAATILVGKYDFKKFSTGKKSKTTVKEIYSIDISSDEKEVKITLHANDFLHNMARMISATLLDVGLDKLKPEDVKTILDINSKLESSPAADSQGLFLAEVLYEKE